MPSRKDTPGSGTRDVHVAIEGRLEARVRDDVQHKRCRTTRKGCVAHRGAGEGMHARRRPEGDPPHSSWRLWQFGQHGDVRPRETVDSGGNREQLIRMEPDDNQEDVFPDNQSGKWKKRERVQSELPPRRAEKDDPGQGREDKLKDPRRILHTGPRDFGGWQRG
mgnify:CR=1 FL=1